MRLKDFSVLNPQYKGESLDCEVSFVPMESLRNGAIDYQDIPFAEGKGKYTYFQDGDLLVAKVTPCFENGNIAIANNMKQGVGFGSSEIFVLRMNDKVLNTYMFYITQTAKFQEGACATMCGVGGLKRISPLFMRTYELDIPSLSKQQRIVDYLDAKLGKIDARIAILEKQQDAYARLKRSVIHHAVTRGLDPNVFLKDSGVEWIGMIPKHWELQRFKSIFTECKSVTETGQEDLLSVSEYYGVARRIDKMEDGKYESRADSLVGYKVCKKDDLVINIMLAWKRGLGFSDFDGIVSPAYAVYRGKDIAPHYFHYLMRTDMYVAEYKRNSKGIIDSRLRMYTDRFNNIIAIVPPLSEQQAIAAYLDEKCSKIDAATENIGKQIDALKRLKRALINEVVTGQRAV
jgi:type I restriction enzyme S subunit